MKNFIILILSILLMSCSKIDQLKRFHVKENAQTEKEILSIFNASPKCKIDKKIIIARAKTTDGSSAYIAQINVENYKSTFRLFRTHFVIGGNKLEGVNYDGMFKVNAFVNYLSNQGEDLLVKIEHYKKGIIKEKAYKFCSFNKNEQSNIHFY